MSPFTLRQAQGERGKGGKGKNPFVLSPVEARTRNGSVESRFGITGQLPAKRGVMARLDLILFGGFQARQTAGPALTLPRKAQALLAYLALTPRQTHPRKKLATLLWGDSGEEQADQSLRQALAGIRKSLARVKPEVLRIEGGAVTLNLTAVNVDVWVFERLIAEGTPDAFKQATELYRGNFLAGLDVKEESFEEWLLAERERLRELAQQALAKLLAHQIRAGAAKQAIQTAVQLLVLDPLQEAVHRTLMRLYAAEGRRAAALRQYQTCVAVLKRELGVEPEAETKQLYQQILREQAAQVMITGAPAEAPMYGQRTGGLEVSPKDAKQSQPKARRPV